MRSASPVPVISTDIRCDVPQTIAPWEEAEAKLATTSSRTTGAASDSLLNYNDAFSLLSLQSTSTTTTTTTTTKATDNSNDLLGLGIDEPSSSLTETSKKVTPEQFLGPNAKLVDFDDLISKPTPQSAVNPFAMTIGKQSVANPFVARAKEEEMSRRVPINQLAGSSTSTSIAPTTLCPTLAVVYSPQTSAPPPQQHGYNPFL
jgi:hypothetical protein